MWGVNLRTYKGRWAHEIAPALWWRYEAEVRRISHINMIRMPLEHYPWNSRGK